MFRRHYLIIAFGLSFFFLAIGFSLYYVRLAEIHSLIIIHFLARHGADVIGAKEDALGILISGSVITILNGILASAFYNRERIVSYLVGIITALITLLILITIIVIINVN